MAIYKTSNHHPNFEEVDVKTPNSFFCTVNTSGESVCAYKIDFLSEDGEKKICDMSQNLSTPVKNKETLFIELDSFCKGALSNNHTYRWNIRTYNKPSQISNRTKLPNTKVCEGFLIGSTKNVIWSKIPLNKKKEIQEQLIYNRFIEFNVSNLNDMIKGAKDDPSLVIKEEDKKQRRKIDWVTKDVGVNEDIIKIETTEPFKFNYKDGVNFKIYNCSDKHTLKSIFVDPNDNINISEYIVIFENPTAAANAHAEGYLPFLENPTNIQPIFPPKKMVGYSSDTGEIRISESYETIPQNGQCYMIFDYDIVTKAYKEKEPKNLDYTTQIIGGNPIKLSSTNEVLELQVLSNKWGDTAENQHIFIQPNINIKGDLYEPDVLIFSNNAQIELGQQRYMDENTWKDIDFTVDKLDNTQWLITPISEVNGHSLIGGGPSVLSGTVPIIPQTDYIIYTSFADSMPENIAYVQVQPEITIKAKNNQDEEDNYIVLDNLTILYKEIEFLSILSYSMDIKYYWYTLYDNNNDIISQSEKLYNNSLKWIYRGLETAKDFNAPQYKIQLTIVNKRGTKIEKESNFWVSYDIQEASTFLDIDLDCHEQAYKINAVTPIFVTSVNKQEPDILETVSDKDIQKSKQGSFVHIPQYKVLNYEHVNNEDKTPLTFPSNNTLLVNFRITKEFLNKIPNGNSCTIFEYGCQDKNDDVRNFELHLTNDTHFYLTEENNGQKKITMAPDSLTLSLYEKMSNNELIPISYINKEGETSLKCSLIEEDNTFIIPEKVAYAYQTTNDYKVISLLFNPDNADTLKKYLLKQDNIYQDKLYVKGIYHIITNNDKNSWLLDYSYNYFYVEDTTATNELTALDNNLFVISPEYINADNSYKIPEDDTALWIDEMDKSYKRINDQIIQDTYFSLYLVVKDNIESIQDNVSTIQNSCTWQLNIQKGEDNL